MIKQFRSLNPVNIILLIGFAIFLRLFIFLKLPAKVTFDFTEPFTKLLFSVPLENTFSSETNIFIALAITLLQAIILNKIVNHYNLLGKPTFLPALLYVTSSTLLTPFALLSPPLICNFLVLWLISKFLSMYRRDDVRSVLFDLGMIVGLGTVFYFPFISMLPLLWISLIIFRPFHWREWIIGLIGFFTIFFFLAVYYFWNDSFDQFYQIWLPLTTPFPTRLRFNIYEYLVLIPLLLIFTLSVFQLRQNFFRSFVQIRKSFQLLFFMFLLNMGSFYLNPEFRVYHFLLCAPPSAILLAYYFLHTSNKRWMYEGLYLVLIGFIIYFQLL